MQLIVEMLETITAFFPFIPNLRMLILSVPAIFGLRYLMGAFGLCETGHLALLIAFGAGYLEAVALGIVGSVRNGGAPTIVPLQTRTGWRVREWPPNQHIGLAERFRLLRSRLREDRRRKSEMLKEYDSERRAKNLMIELAQVSPEDACEKYLQLTRHTMLEYEEYNRKTVRCWVRMYPRSRRVVAIATDMTSKLHTGASITNTIETVALQICLQFHIAPPDLVLIEHYDRTREHGVTSLGDQDEDFDMVELRWNRRTKEFRDPRWHRLFLMDVERVTGSSPLGDWCTELVKCD